MCWRPIGVASYLREHVLRPNAPEANLRRTRMGLQAPTHRVTASHLHAEGILPHAEHE